MSLENLQQARREIDNANRLLKDEAEKTIRDELERIFIANPTFKTIDWAQKHSEYNDEGMYEGVFGPVANEISAEEQRNDDDWPDWLYGYGGTKVVDELKELHSILNAVGEEVLSDIFGDECRVTASWDVSKAKVYISSEYAGV